jgi:tetratricopeptide (TPR) repeat protein
MAHPLSLLLAALGGAAVSLFFASDLWQPPPPSLAGTSTNDPDQEVKRLGAELAELQKRLAERDSADSRTAATPAVPPPAAEATITPTDLVMLERMLRELGEQHGSGVLRRYYTTRLPELAELLMRVWVETGAPQLAFVILRDIGVHLQGIHRAYPGAIVKKLREANDPLAHDAALLALRINIEDARVIADLAKHDPQSALDALDAHERANAGDPNVAASLRDERCRLLMALKNMKDALPLFDQLLAEGNADEGLWQRLLELDPAAAASRLQGLIAKTEPDEAFGLELQLAKAVLAAGDRTAARNQLEALLQRSPDHGGVVELLAKVDQAAADEFLQRQVRERPSPATWANLGRRLLAAGKAGEAHEAMWNSFLAAPNDLENQMRVIALAPEQFAERIVQHVRQNSRQLEGFDELLGDVGEVYWRAGQRDRAIAVWREAQQRDPGDGEWRYKLTRATAGRDPLGGSRNQEWWLDQDG